MARVRTLTRKSPEQIAAERRPIATVVREVVFARQRKLFDGLPMVNKTKVFDEQFNKSVAAITR